MLSDTSLNPEQCKPAFATKPFMVQLSRQVNKFKKILQTVYLLSVCTSLVHRICFILEK